MLMEYYFFTHFVMPCYICSMWIVLKLWSVCDSWMGNGHQCVDLTVPAVQILRYLDDVDEQHEHFQAIFKKKVQK